MDAPTRRAGPSLGLSIAIIICGVTLGIVPAVKVASAIFESVVSPKTVPVPGRARMHLNRGTYVVFQRTGTTTGGGGFSFTTDNGVSLNPALVAVTSTSGESVGVHIPGGNETITRGSHRYTGAAEFKVPAAGDYDIRVEAPAQPDVLVTRSLGDTFRSLLPWIGIGVLAGLVFASGVALLIVGEVRRHRQDRPPPLPPWPPPGWQPPPSPN